MIAKIKKFIEKTISFVKDAISFGKKVKDQSIQETVAQVEDAVIEKSLSITNDTKQLANSIFSTLIECVKVAMATLLSIFVPQYCEETGTTCTLQDNFSNLSSFNELVIAWNFISLLLFLRLAWIQNKREAYLIKHLDESRDHPYNSLTKNCKGYPKILSRVKDHNNLLYFWTNTVIIFFTINVLLSSILVFHFFYDGFRTITTLLANVLLVSSKLFMLSKICKQCRQAKMLALSTIEFTSVSFNVIDDDYSKEEENNGKYRMSIRIDKKGVEKLMKRKASRRSLSVDSRPMTYNPVPLQVEIIK